jgi:hypothetical protein
VFDGCAYELAEDVMCVGQDSMRLIQVGHRITQGCMSGNRGIGVLSTAALWLWGSTTVNPWDSGGCSCLQGCQGDAMCAERAGRDKVLSWGVQQMAYSGLEIWRHILLLLH